MNDDALMDQLDRAIDAMLGGDKQTESADPALAPLAEIAGRLRDIPDDRFKTRLSQELQSEFGRRTPMTTSTTAAIHAITPFITVPEGAQLIEFMKHT